MISLILARCGLGLSPRRRGNRIRYLHEQSEQGPIPAKAGEPERGYAISSALRAYPREGGGTSSARKASALRWGLSPRRRGNPLKMEEDELITGPIPAKAGEPCCSPCSYPARGAYPREGGGTDSLLTLVC